jgi:hypothetical protein
MMELYEEEQQCLNEDEAKEVEWHNASKPKRCRLIAKAGGNPDAPNGSWESLGEENNLIYVSDLQELTYPLASAKNTIHNRCCPIEGLNWQQVTYKHPMPTATN